MSARGETILSLGRLRGLAEAIRRGDPLQNVRADFDEIAAEADTVRISPLLLELVAEGVGRQEVRQLVVWCRERASSSDDIARYLAAGHPAEILQRENGALQQRVDRLRTAVQRLPGSADAFTRASRSFRDLSEVDNHYRRQEFLLFTRLEHHDIVRPGRILWAAHDEIRQWLKYLALKFADGAFDAESLAALADSVVEPLLADILWMVFLEQSLLLPIAMEILDDADWAIIHKHSPKIGWCLVEPGRVYRPSTTAASEHAPQCMPEILTPGGTLEFHALAKLHAQLPVDLTFVDADDRVRYFSEGILPVFYRSEAVLGRDVRNCHPPRSVHYVDQILADFKSGRESSAQFWKRMGNRFIHIRFVAIRDTSGTYQGALEIAQDITQLRRLEGQQLELRYDRTPT